MSGISSNGTTVTYTSPTASMTWTNGHYTGDTGMASVSHDSTESRRSGFTAVTQYSGPTQECHNGGRGLNAESNITMVGSPQLFSGQDMQAADGYLSDLRALILQPGDNRHDTNLASLVSFDLQSATSAMTTSAADEFAPTPPQINRLQDLPQFTTYFSTWLASISAANSAYSAACAGKLEIERQLMQKQITLECLREQYGDLDFQSILGGKIGLPSSEDIENRQYNITRMRVLENYIPFINGLLAAEQNMC